MGRSQKRQSGRSGRNRFKWKMQRGSHENSDQALEIMQNPGRIIREIFCWPGNESCWRWLALESRVEGGKKDRGNRGGITRFEASAVEKE